MMKKQPRLVGWRYGLAIASFVGTIGLALYPIIVYPMYHPDYYKEIQAVGRKDIVQEDIQPGNMRVWSNPFEPRK